MSPHADDLALSATHLMQYMGRLPNARFHLVTCFGISEYTPFEGQYRSEELPGIRRKEDLDYLARLPFRSTRLSSLDQLDAPLRADWPPGADIRDPASYHLGAEDIAAHGPALSRLLRETRSPGALHLVPIGLLHKDHLIATSAAIDAFEPEAMIFYEDWPYAMSQSAEELAGRAQEISDAILEPLTRLRLTQAFNLEPWLRCLRVYRSQFKDEDLVAMGDDLKARGGEMVWAAPRAIRWLERMEILPYFERVGSIEPNARP